MFSATKRLEVLSNHLTLPPTQPKEKTSQEKIARQKELLQFFCETLTEKNHSTDFIDTMELKLQEWDDHPLSLEETEQLRHELIRDFLTPTQKSAFLELFTRYPFLDNEREKTLYSKLTQRFIQVGFLTNLVQKMDIPFLVELFSHIVLKKDVAVVKELFVVLPEKEKKDVLRLIGPFLLQSACKLDISSETRKYLMLYLLDEGAELYSLPYPEENPLLSLVEIENIETLKALLLHMPKEKAKDVVNEVFWRHPNFVDFFKNTTLSSEQKIQLLRILFEAGYYQRWNNEYDSIILTLAELCEEEVIDGIADLFSKEHFNGINNNDPPLSKVGREAYRMSLPYDAAQKTMKVLLQHGANPLAIFRNKTILQLLPPHLRRFFLEVLSPQERQKILSLTYKKSSLLQIYYNESLSSTERGEKIRKFFITENYTAHKETIVDFLKELILQNDLSYIEWILSLPEVQHIKNDLVNSESFFEIYDPGHIYSNRNHKGKTIPLLFVAAKVADGSANSYKILSTLLDAGANPLALGFVDDEEEDKWNLFHELGSDAKHETIAFLSKILPKAVIQELLRQSGGWRELSPLLTCCTCLKESSEKRILPSGEGEIYWSERPHQLETILLFLSLGADPLAIDAKKRNLLTLLFKRERFDTILPFLERVPENIRRSLIRHIDEKGKTALIRLCKQSHWNQITDPIFDESVIALMGMFLDEGISLSHTDHKGNSCIHYLARECSLERLRFLSRRSPEEFRKILHQTNSYGDTPLLEVANGFTSNEHYEWVKLSREEEKKQEIARINQQVEIILFMIDQGADVFAVNPKGKNLFYILIKEGKIEVLLALIPKLQSREIDLNRLFHARDYKGKSLFFQLCKNFEDSPLHLQVLRLLLGNDVSPLYQDKDGKNCFHYLARANAYAALQCIFLLLPKETTIQIASQRDKDGFLPLHDACSIENGKSPSTHFQTIITFLQLGLDPTVKTDEGKDICQLLIKGSNFSTLRLVLMHLPQSISMSVLRKNSEQNETILHAIFKESYGLSEHPKKAIDINELVRFVLENGIDPLQQDNKGNTCFHLLLERNYTYEKKPSLLDPFFSLSASIRTQLCNTINKQGKTAFSLVVEAIDRVDHISNFSPRIYPILLSLLLFGIDIFSLDGNGKTLIEFLIERSNKSKFRVLRFGTEEKENNLFSSLALFLNKISDQEKQALLTQYCGGSHLLATWFDVSEPSRTDRLELLIRQKADPLIQDGEGKTILHRLCEEKSESLILLLLETYPPKTMKALLQKQDVYGNTATFYLLGIKNPKIFDLFLRYEANFSQKNFQTETPLEIISKKWTENIPLLEFLLDQGLFRYHFSTGEINHFLEGIIHDRIKKEEKQFLYKLLSSLPESKQTLHKILSHLRTGNYENNLVKDFYQFIQFKLPLYCKSEKMDAQTSALFDVFKEIHRVDAKHGFLLDARFNETLSTHPKHLKTLHESFKKYYNTPHEEAVRVAIQTCGEIELFKTAIHSLDHPACYQPSEFVRLPLNKQKELLSRYVVFRDRMGLFLAGHILHEASQNPHMLDPEIITLSLELIGKIQILDDPDHDEHSLLTLIVSLIETLDTNQHPEGSKLLSKAIFSLAKLDIIHLRKQYKAGLFEVFERACQYKQNDLLLSCIEALSGYGYDPNDALDLTIIHRLVDLANDNSLLPNLKKALADILSTIKEEKALLKAWEIVQGPTWDTYKIWEERQNRLQMGDFMMFPFRPEGLHDNRESIRKRVLDLLGVCHAKKYQMQVQETYDRFLQTPQRYPSLAHYQSHLLKLPPSGIRFMDPLYLPKDAHVFRGISSRHGEKRAHDAVLDLFRKGVGSCELTRAVRHESTWAKVGQIFCALDLGYVRMGFLDKAGALIVLDGNFINEMNMKRRVRQQKEHSSMHYVLYDTISHDHIKKIYIDQTLLAELIRLREADPENMPKDLDYFHELEEAELIAFIRALQSDPHKLFQKLEGADLSSIDPKEKETPYSEVVEENVKREILRNIVQKAYFPLLEPVSPKAVSTKKAFVRSKL